MQIVALRIIALVNMSENIFFVLYDNVSNVCGLSIDYFLITVDAIVVMLEILYET